MSKKNVLTPEQLNKQSADRFTAINGQSDLASVLIASSWVEQARGTLLQRFFIKNSSTGAKLLDPGGAVGTFGSRIDLAYAVGLSGQGMMQDLQQITHIRETITFRGLNRCASPLIPERIRRHAQNWDFDAPTRPLFG